MFYKGKKRVHAIKFQSLALPYGLTGNLSGPYKGRRYDIAVLQTPFSRQSLIPNQVIYNKAMSQTRVSVDWMFNEIKTYFKFILLKSQTEIELSAVGKIYCVCDLLQNARTCRRNHRRCFIKKGVFRNFTKFRGKHLRQSLFFNKVAGLRTATLLKRGSGTSAFLWILRNF